MGDDTENGERPPREFDVILTDTAKSKAFRYLSSHAIEDAVRTHSGPVYYDGEQETYFLPTTRTRTSAKWNHEREEIIVLIIALTDSDEAVIITQTGDHYDWEHYEPVEELGAKPGAGADGIESTAAERQPDD